MKRQARNNKNSTSWISSSFGDAHNDMQITKVLSNAKKQKSNVKETTSDNNGSEYVSWLESFAPAVETDLAVNKKKIEEVKEWLNNSLSQRCGKILLLTGPCGCGKSAVIKVLAKLFSCEIKEWINPVTEQFQDRSERTWNPYENNYESQNQKFSDFILRANRYNSLCLAANTQGIVKQKIVLVEDFPNFVFRDPAKFQAILRQYQQTGRSPLVFILSDSNQNDSSAHSIFPNSFQQELNITNISFNAVAPTQLKSLVNKIIKLKQDEDDVLSKPSKDVIDLLIATGNGDIRSCVNSLQFYCTNSNPIEEKRQTKPLKKPKNASKKKSVKKCDNNDSVLLESGRDQSLFLFRSLGKVLYCKRNPLSKEEKNVQLPSCLTHHSRDLLQENPEVVFERTQVTADSFLLYMHHNYLPFYSDIDDACMAGEYFSDADVLSSCWNPQANLSNYSSSVSIRGVMFANTNQTKTNGWRPLQKPDYFRVFKTITRRTHISRELFKESGFCNEMIFCEKIPYLGRMLPSNYSGYQSFFKEMLSFGTNVFKPQLLVDRVNLNSSFSWDQSEETYSVLQGDTCDEFAGGESGDDIEDFEE